MLCCGYTLTNFPISIRLTSLALWQSNDCPSASKATLMNMDKYFMWIHYERLYNHNKAKHNKTVCIFLGIYCICRETSWCRLCSTQSFPPIHISPVSWWCVIFALYTRACLSEGHSPYITRLSADIPLTCFLGITRTITEKNRKLLPLLGIQLYRACHTI